MRAYVHCSVYENQNEVSKHYYSNVGYFDIFIACEAPTGALASISVKATDFAKHYIYQIIFAKNYRYDKLLLNLR